MLNDALERNLDVIHDRLPQQRRRRRRLSAMGLIAFAAVLVVTSAAVARKPAASPVRAGGRPAPSARAAAAATPAARLDPAMLTQPITPGLLELAVRRVVVDAGHGGGNPGTSSVNGLKEKDLTLDIAERVRRLLSARGFDVVMTRTRDETLSLQQRAEQANAQRGDIFVSIHLNWLQTTEVRGIETFYLGPARGTDLDAIVARENQESGYSLADMRSLLERIYTDARRDESRRLATRVQQSLIDTLKRKEPDIADRGVKRAPFVVLGATLMPAILAEVSCLSNADQAEHLKTPEARQRIAEALVSGIDAFAHESRGTVAERTGSHGS